MSVRTPLDTARRSRTGVHRAVGVPIALCIVLAVTLLGSLAGADTPTVHQVRASVGAQSNVAPPGPLTNLSVVADSPSSITLRVTEGTGQTISGLNRIALCKGGIAVSNVADLFPSDTGNCLDQPLQPGTLSFVTNVTKATITDNFIETTVKVGSGTRQVPFDDGGGAQTSTITCDATHDCSLWIQIARTGGNDLVHYDLDYGAASGTTTSTTAAPGSTTTTTAPTTTTTSTTTSSSTTSTTAAPGSTTTTTAAGGSTTTTTAAGGSTTSTTAFTPMATCASTASTTSTTVAGASTTSTTAGSSTTSSTSTTSTTLPSGTTVSGSAAAGGTITVSSTGWLPNAKVTGFLCSDPVTLGTLTANASGAISGTFAVPSNIPAGKHTFELGGKGTSGATRSIKADVTITAAAGGSTTSTTAGSGGTGGGTTGGSTGGSTGGGIPTTGSNVSKMLGAGFLILVAGGLFAVSAIQRRGRLSFDR